MARTELRGRLVLDDGVATGRIVVEDEWIAEVDVDAAGSRRSTRRLGRRRDGPLYSRPASSTSTSTAGAATTRWARPTISTGWPAPSSAGASPRSCRPGWTTPMPVLHGFADARPRLDAERARPTAPSRSGSTSRARSSRRRGRAPTTRRSSRRRRDVPWSEIEPLVDGLRLTTIAPEIPGALELIALAPRARRRGRRLATPPPTWPRPSPATTPAARTTTHLFNAMTGIEHRAPGVAVAALDPDDAFVELIADGHHVDPALWPIVQRTKPIDRLILVSDALAMAGMGDGRVTVGGMEIDIVDGRCTIVGTSTLAGSVIALDTAMRNLVRHGSSLPAAVAAASANPLEMLGVEDRGRLASRAARRSRRADGRPRRVARLARRAGRRASRRRSRRRPAAASRQAEAFAPAFLPVPFEASSALRALSQSARNWTMPLSVSG